MVGVLVLDCGTGLQEPAARAAQAAADQIVLISDAHPSTASLVAEAAELLRTVGPPMTLVVNKMPRKRRPGSTSTASSASCPDAQGLVTSTRTSGPPPACAGDYFAGTTRPDSWRARDPRARRRPAERLARPRADAVATRARGVGACDRVGSGSVTSPTGRPLIGPWFGTRMRAWTTQRDADEHQHAHAGDGVGGARASRASRGRRRSGSRSPGIAGADRLEQARDARLVVARAWPPAARSSPRSTARRCRRRRGSRRGTRPAACRRWPCPRYAAPIAAVETMISPTALRRRTSR